MKGGNTTGGLSFFLTIKNRSIVAVNSGCASNCALCGATENLEIHHISYNPPKTVVVCRRCHQRIHGNLPIIDELKVKIAEYDRIVQLITLINNWKKGYSKDYGMEPHIDTSFLRRRKRELEIEIKQIIKSEGKKILELKCISGILLAKLLAYAHPKRFPSLRKFLHYCGFKKSARITNRYSRKAKTTVWLMVRMLIMTKNEVYYPLYLRIKQKLSQRFPNYSKRRIDGMARLRVGVFLLKYLYEVFSEEAEK